MMKMITPNTNISAGSVKTAFIKDKAVTGDKISTTGATDTQVLSYDASTDTVVWSDGIADDIEIGDILLRDVFPAYGVSITNPADKGAWSSVVLKEYGGDYSGNDELPYNFHNPSISGEVHGGTPASPTAVSAFTRTASLIGNARFGTGANDSDTVGNITISTNENQTATNRGGKIGFSVNPTGGGTDTKEVMILNADANANFVFDPNGDFNNTTISTQSTNGFQWQNSNTFQNDVQMNQGLDVTGNLTIDGSSTFNDPVTFTDSTTFNNATTFNQDATYNNNLITTQIDSTSSSIQYQKPVTLDIAFSDPSGLPEATMYFNSTTKEFMGYDGTDWNSLGGTDFGDDLIHFDNGTVATGDVFVVGNTIPANGTDKLSLGFTRYYATGGDFAGNEVTSIAKATLSATGSVASSGGINMMTVATEFLTPTKWSSINLTDTAQQVNGMTGMHPTNGKPIYYYNGWKYFNNDGTAS